MIKKTREFLKGKKTYIVATIAILESLVEFSVTGDVGAMVNKIMAAVGAITLRAGVENSKN